ncbi:uncharacterized protein SOCE26_069100 [Sorangium cellulosum]|uniref:Secreted protein n=1 Tax=Sorangium cellulosum TaxID=56 RepID=A0A2L0F1R5_SORCE|nr:hypothetical protein [Sorangium cellulosum]AUX45419.1 uncharacterized protein SOCE26_069100 [Sorangium cellulosum]
MKEMRDTLLGRRRRAFLVCLALTVGAGAAYAATTTNAPGAYCTATLGQSLTVRSDGEVENSSPDDLIVLCPVERPDSSTTVSGTAFVVDRKSSSNICCNLVAKGTAGATINGTSACSDGTSASTQTLALPQITDTMVGSSRFVQCTLPGLGFGESNPSRIQMYRTVQ